MIFSKVLTLAVLTFVSQNLFAQNLRPCTQEVLTCKLENTRDFYHRRVLDQSRTPFSGLNNDEPSIQPDQCRILTALSGERGVFYTVDLGDKDHVAHIFARDKAKISQTLPGSVAFAVVSGKTFYYSYDEELLTCQLK